MDERDRRQPAVVLLACDEPGALELLARVVTREGWRSEVAPDVDAALERAAARLPRCVVVHLPRGGIGSALELVGRVRSHADERVATAALVVVETLANRELLLAAGADVHLERPVHVREVAGAVGAAFSIPHAPGAGAPRVEVEHPAVLDP
jgi:DNA-binding response OmpR family regulator